MFEIAPPVLYKYRTFDLRCRNLSIIKHSEIWFACAKDFNDPFDMSFEYNFDGLHSELGLNWARNAVNRHENHLNPEQRERRALERITEIRKDPEYLKEVKKDFVEHNQNTFGVCSLCATNNDLLVWAHYSQNHTGFCVGLSVEHLNKISISFIPQKILLDIHKVNYTDVYPSPNFFDCMINLENTSHINDVIETKSTDWKYEKEWRLIFWGQVNKSLNLGFEAIHEVILGCRISAKNKKNILELCRRHVPHAKIFQAVKDSKKFGLTLEPIQT